MPTVESEPYVFGRRLMVRCGPFPLKRPRAARHCGVGLKREAVRLELLSSAGHLLATPTLAQRIGSDCDREAGAHPSAPPVRAHSDFLIHTRT